MKKTNKKLLFLATSLLGIAGMVNVALATDVSIPDARRIDWTEAGVPGGIPTRTIICSSAECNTVSSGNVTADTINAAIKSAPANSVVQIPAGTYQMTTVINIFRSDVVLRGAGMGQTVLDLRHNGSAITVGDYNIYAPDRTISGGSTKGSTSIQVADVSNVRPDLLLSVTEDDEPFMWSRAGATNMLQQVVKVNSVSGNTINFSPPLVYNFSHNPKFGLSQSYWLPTDHAYNVGIENLTIDGTQAVDQGNSITFWASYASWVKNVEISGFGDTGIFFYQSLQNTVHGCYIHGPVSYNEGFGVYLYGHSTANLVENNRFYNLWLGVMGQADVGNVVAYNYVTGNLANVDWPYQDPAFNYQHGPHSMMSLYEGNVGNQFQDDGYHGSGSHGTLFRNKFDGLSSLYTGNRKMVDLTRFSRYFNVIGNVLGDASWKAAGYEMTGMPDYNSQPVIYRLGYPNMGNNSYSDVNPPSNADDGGFDPAVKATLVRDHNFDYLHNSVQSCSSETEGCQGVTGDTLPNSLYLSSKPSWWCQESAWPPINPDGATSDSRYSKIPAQIMSEGGKCTTSGSSDTNPPAAPSGLAVN